MMEPMALPASFLSPLGCQRIAVRSAAARHRVVAQVPLAAAALAAPEEAARPQARSVRIGRAAPHCIFTRLKTLHKKSHGSLIAATCVFIVFGASLGRPHSYTSSAC